jgi:hypothetical protein
VTRSASKKKAKLELDFAGGNMDEEVTEDEVLLVASKQVKKGTRPLQHAATPGKFLNDAPKRV